MGVVEEAGEAWDGDVREEEGTRIFAVACGDGSSCAATETSARTFSSFDGVVNGFWGSLRRDGEQPIRWLDKRETYDGQCRTRQRSGGIRRGKIR